MGKLVSSLYTPRVREARQRFESGIAATLRDPGMDPARFELFLIQYCSRGVRMTEPVESWIFRVGQRCEALGLPFAPIAKPEDLFDDPHLKASDGLSRITLPNGMVAEVPVLPLEMDGRRFGARRDLPRVGEHTCELLAGLGYEDRAIEALIAQGVIAASG